MWHGDVRNHGVELIRIRTECVYGDLRVGMDSAAISQDA
jgi:hypothetical protein